MPEETDKKDQKKRFMSDQLMLELGRHLMDKGIITREQINDVNSRCAITGNSFAQLLVSEKLAPEPEVLAALSTLTHIPFCHIADFTIDTDAVAAVPARVALRYEIMPVDLEKNVITLATSNVPDSATIDSMHMLLGLGLDWVLCTDIDIKKSVKHFYGLGADSVDDLIEATSNEEIEIKGTDVSRDSEEAGVITFVNQIIFEAIRMTATDIHLEPFEDNLRLRYRIDGILQRIPIPKGIRKLSKAISSCVKIMADMDIAERRKPHDGRIQVRSGGDEFDLRVSILPTRFGETVNMRILNRKSMFIDLNGLGLNNRQLPVIKELSDLPHGVILLTGPTGSGKTTTLYAILSRINTDEVKIITVEDPIEYQINGINQIQVQSQIGVTFASILRSILRHDPDIILIGEIRDMETADIAVRASLTGHLVFSTLHTNDAPSAITRLIDMGVEPFLVSSCLEGIIAQRLVRRVCNKCRTEMTPDDMTIEEIGQYFPKEIKTAKFYKGHGCPDCNFTGFRGRIALFEIMVLNDVLRGMVVHRRPSNEIRNKALEYGLVTLRHDGWARALEGVTSVDEVMRVARKIEQIDTSNT